jgi:hypothetical protein
LPSPACTVSLREAKVNGASWMLGKQDKLLILFVDTIGIEPLTSAVRLQAISIAYLNISISALGQIQPPQPTFIFDPEQLVSRSNRNGTR